MFRWSYGALTVGAEELPTLWFHIPTLDSKKLEHGCAMICAAFASFFGLGLEDSRVETF